MVLNARCSLDWRGTPILPGRRTLGLRPSRSCLLNAVETRLLVEPPTSSCNLAFTGQVTMPHRAIRRGSTAPTDSHPSIGLGEVVLVELNAQFGRVK